MRDTDLTSPGVQSKVTAPKFWEKTKHDAIIVFQETTNCRLQMINNDAKMACVQSITMSGRLTCKKM